MLESILLNIRWMLLNGQWVQMCQRLHLHAQQDALLLSSKGVPPQGTQLVYEKACTRTRSAPEDMGLTVSFCRPGVLHAMFAIASQHVLPEPKPPLS